MNADLSCLVDPETKSPLHVRDGWLENDRGTRYPIVDGIPRFVPPENYARAFGDQWQRFPLTQHDSHAGLRRGVDRLSRCMRGQLSEVRGKRVLEAGAGAGRFSEILLGAGAVLHSFDYSSSVDVIAANSGRHESLTLFQGDIRQIPCPRESYDYVICLGVIQHTPDPHESMRSLWSHVKPGGALVIDQYRWTWWNSLPPPLGEGLPPYRRYVLRLPPEQQYAAVERIFEFWYPIVWRFRDSRVMQILLSRVSPLAVIYPKYGLRDAEMYREWMLLMLHDALTDHYKHLCTPREMRRFLESLGAVDIVVTTGGNGVEAFCRKPG